MPTTWCRFAPRQSPAGALAPAGAAGDAGAMVASPVRRHRIVVAREQYKFSCAHMTVFPDGTKERLHGHNYQLGAVLELTDVGFAQMIPFAAIKDALAAICKQFRERVLLAEANPLMQIVKDDAEELEARVCGKRYVFPREDVLLLPIDNVSAEALAAYLAERLVADLAPSRI